MKTQWTIGKKLLLAFTAVAVIVLLLGGVGYYGAVHSGRDIEEIGLVHLPGVECLLTICETQVAVDSAEKALLSTGLDAGQRAAQHERFAEARKRADDAWKVYDALPRSEPEEALWQAVLPPWQRWWKDHDDYLKLVREFEALGIPDPPAFQRDVQRFIADHYKLNMQVLDHIQAGAECKGGEDPTACNFGKWLAGFTSSNADLERSVSFARPSHDAFHAAVKRAKESAAKGDKEGGEKIVHTDMEQAAQKTFENFDTLLALANRGNDLYARMNHHALVTQGASFATAEKPLKSLAQAESKAAAETSRSAKLKASRLKVINASAIFVGVTLALGLGLLITRGINKVMKQIADALAAGSEQTAAAAAQVSSSSQSLAEGASEQAAALEETSSSLEEMGSMTRRNTENAQKANDLARQARQAAERGSTDMQAMSAAMDAIKVSSDDIAKIIKTIDEIAFQTNILALNAAVEAARAGEAGMGFAVVADEVRNLAQRSAHAAKETSAKIEGAISRTAQGVEISAKVASGLSDIVAKARQVDELAAEVANASREQTQGITQINTAVTQMDKVTQSNAANAEESASAAEELNAQAESLKEAVASLLQLVNGDAAVHSSASRTHLSKSKRAVTHEMSGTQSLSAPAKKNGHGRRQIPASMEPPSPAAALARERAIPLETEFKDF